MCTVESKSHQENQNHPLCGNISLLSGSPSKVTVREMKIEQQQRLSPHQRGSIHQPTENEEELVSEETWEQQVGAMTEAGKN